MCVRNAESHTDEQTHSIYLFQWCTIFVFIYLFFSNVLFDEQLL